MIDVLAYRLLKEVVWKTHDISSIINPFVSILVAGLMLHNILAVEGTRIFRFGLSLLIFNNALSVIWILVARDMLQDFKRTFLSAISISFSLSYMLIAVGFVFFVKLKVRAC